MKKLILKIVILIAVSVPSFPAIAGIPLSDADLAHITGSMYLTKLCKSNGLGEIETVLIVFGLGVLKELYDTNTTGFSVNDLGMNLSGVLLSYTIDFGMGADND